MNIEAATIQDCIENYQVKGNCAIINDGQIIGFIERDKKEAGNL